MKLDHIIQPQNCFIPPHSMYSLQHDSTIDCSDTMIVHYRPSLLDTDVNNDDDSQYFEDTIKHNKSATEIRDTNTKPTQGQIKLRTLIFKHSPSKPTTSLKLLPYGK